MRSVLIVDDEEVIRESIAGMLRRRYPDQLELAQAENGKRALEYVCSHPVSLVIADIKMPVLSGLDMLERLTELAYMGEVIFISGFDDYALVRRAMKLGAADYLLKPIMEADFYTQIDGFLLREQHRLPKTQEKLTVQRRAYRQQYALERLLTGGAEREVLEENGLQAEQPCILCVLDTAAGVLPSAQLADEWSAQLAPLVTDGCVLLQGEWNKQRMVLFCFHQRAQERAFRAYQQWSFGEHATMVFSKPYPLCKVGEAFKDCQELLRQSFYDDIAKDGEACYPYSALMAGMVSALCALEEERWITLLEGLLALACAQKPPVESLRQLLCSMIYAAIQQNSVFVRLIAIHELTQDDALRCIQGSMGVTALKKELER
ncbi:MAG: response regulator, partial [Clostridia bacterium]